MQIEIPDPSHSNTLTYHNCKWASDAEDEARQDSRNLYFVINNKVYILLAHGFKDTGILYINGDFARKI